MSARLLSPVERVRARIAAEAGPSFAREIPNGYQRLGRVLLVRLPESLRPHFSLIGRAWQSELGVQTVLRRAGTVSGELRVPATELLAGQDTETEVVEYGLRWTFDATRVMFAQGNRSERRRAGLVTRPGETVIDLFAGVGYFTIPAAVRGRARRVLAVEKNPVAFGYLLRNIARNGVADRVEAHRGDNREVPLPRGAADRIFLGYLPSSVPWVERALPLLRPDGGTMHVHLVTEVRDGGFAAESAVRAAVARAGGETRAIRARRVKPYGPGRDHRVLDVEATPRPSGGG
jgi:tRNA wybutosine-synthesizing protein 2